MAESFIQDIVENPHTVYRRYFHYWNFLLDSYEGGYDYTQANIPRGVNDRQSSPIQIKVNGEDLREHSGLNLFKHEKEKTSDYQRRLDRSYYFNFCAPIIDIYTDHLFRNPVTEDFGNIEDIVDKRKENIDRRGSSIIELRKEMAESAQIYGHYFALVDMPSDNGEINMQQRIDNDKFPYISLFPPQHVINWSLDRWGRPFWVVLAEPLEGPTDPFSFDKTQTNKPQANYRLWTRDEWVLFNNDYERIDEGRHGVGVVPLVPVYNKPSKKFRSFLGISELADISFIMRDVYNLCSELNQIITDQTFSFLAIQGQITDYGGDQTLGTGKGLIYPENANVPQYVGPAPDNARVIMDQIDRQINKAFQLAKLEGGSAHQEQQVTEQSGISKAFDFHQTNSALSKKASNLNDAELKIWQLVAAWEGRDFEGSVSYPDDFSVSDVNDDLDEALKMIKLNIGKMAEVEMNKVILKKKFPRMEEAEFDLMISDMEKSVGDNQMMMGVNGNGNGGRLRDRLNLFRNSSPNSGAGKQNQGGQNAGRSSTSR